MRQILLVVLMTIAFGTSFAQKALNGNWYCRLEDTTIGFTFNETAASIGLFDTHLKPTLEARDMKIQKVVVKHGHIYYLLIKPTNENEFALFVVSELKPYKSFIQYEGPRTAGTFSSIADALSFVDADTITHFGLLVYSEKEFKRLTALPDAMTITKADYKKFLQKVIERYTRIMEAQKKDNTITGELVYTYQSQQFNVVLGELNYNPMIAAEQKGAFFSKYESDSELSALERKVEELQGFKNFKRD